MQTSQNLGATKPMCGHLIHRPNKIIYSSKGGKCIVEMLPKMQQNTIAFQNALFQQVVAGGARSAHPILFLPLAIDAGMTLFSCVFV